jgi:hypothetical protein
MGNKNQENDPIFAMSDNVAIDGDEDGTSQ